MFSADHLENVPQRAPDCWPVMALTPEVHRARDVGFLLEIVPGSRADVLPIGIFCSRQTGSGSCGESLPSESPTGSGTAPPEFSKLVLLFEKVV